MLIVFQNTGARLPRRLGRTGKIFGAGGTFKIRQHHATATLPQQAIAAFLARGGYDRYLRNVRAQYAQQVERTIHAIAKYFPEGTRSTHPEGGFVLWVELPETVRALELHTRALEKNISIAPGPLFSARGKYQNCIRLNCAQPWDDKLEWALLTLGRLTHSLT